MSSAVGLSAQLALVFTACSDLVAVNGDTEKAAFV